MIDGNDVGDYEVHALSNVLRRPIYVVNISTGQVRKEGDNIDTESLFESEPIVLGLYPEIRNSDEVVERGHYIWLNINWPSDCNYEEYIMVQLNSKVESSDSITLSEESQLDEDKPKKLNSRNSNDLISMNQKSRKKNSKKKNKRSSSNSSR